MEHGVLESERINRRNIKILFLFFFFAKGNEGAGRGRTQPTDYSSEEVHFLLGSLQSKAIY